MGELSTTQKKALWVFANGKPIAQSAAHKTLSSSTMRWLENHRYISRAMRDDTWSITSIGMAVFAQMNAGGGKISNAMAFKIRQLCLAERLPPRTLSPQHDYQGTIQDRPAADVCMIGFRYRDVSTDHWYIVAIDTEGRKQWCLINHAIK